MNDAPSAPPASPGAHLDPSDPHYDLESMHILLVDEERTRIMTIARNEYKNLNDWELGRLTRCNHILRREAAGGPPRSAKKPNPKRVAMTLPADLSDIPE